MIREAYWTWSSKLEFIYLSKLLISRKQLYEVINDKQSRFRKYKFWPFFKSVIYIELKITIKSEKKDDDTITVIYFVVTWLHHLKSFMNSPNMFTGSPQIFLHIRHTCLCLPRLLKGGGRTLIEWGKVTLRLLNIARAAYFQILKKI